MSRTDVAGVERIVGRRIRAPRIEVARVRARLAERMFGQQTAPLTLAGYDVVERLGSGAQGDVYLVEDPRLDRRLALKVLRDRLAGRGLEEARALAQVVDDHVVPVFDAGVLDAEGDGEARPYLVMEYVEGVSLRAWCAQAQEASARIGVLLGAGRGLAAAHRAGVVHGDFKPSNVMVGSDGRARVLDFGLARAIDEAATETAASGTGSGTPGYRAPECAQRRPDAASDQYSFCATAWELLFDPPLPRRRGRLGGVRRVLRRGLQRRSGDRFLSMDALLAELTRATGRTTAAALAAIAVGGTAAVVWATSGDPDGCARVGEEFGAVWSVSRQEALRSGFVEAAPGYGSRSWKRVHAGVERASERWREQRTALCEAFASDDVTAPPAADVRQRCLARRLAELDAWLGGLTDADADLVRRAPDDVGVVLSRIGCEAESDRDPAGASAQVIAERDEVRTALARAAGLLRARRHESATEMLEALSARTEAWPDDALTAELALRLGHARFVSGRQREALPLLERAAFLASASAADRIYADAGLQLMQLLGLGLADFEGAAKWEAHARAALVRLDDTLGLRRLALRWTWILARAGKPSEAKALLVELHEQLRDATGDDRSDLARVFVNLARVETLANHSEEALRWATRAVELQAELGGEGHPDYADALFRLGVAQEQRADLTAARATFEHALAVHERYSGTSRVLGVHNGLAIVLERMGDLDGAQTHYQWVLDVLERDGESMRGGVVAVSVNLGALANARHEPEAALPHFRKALRVAEEIYEEGHSAYIPIRYGLGVAHGRLGHHAESIDHLRHSVALAEASGGDRARVGKSRYVLGQAMWESPEHRSEAVAFVRLGIAELMQDAEAYAEELDEARTWLEARGLAETATEDD